MKLTCSQSELTQALSIVNRAVSPNNTLPVLNNILLKAEGKKLFLTATNLEIAIHASIDAQIQNEGSLTLPSKAFGSYVSLLNDDTVQLTVVSGNTLEIFSKGSDTKIKGIASEEFPSLPKLGEPQSFTLPAKDLKSAIEQVVFAASTNISRPVLTGLFWQISGKIVKLVATDSYRLAEKTVTMEKDSEVDLSFITPAKTAQEIAKILSAVDAEEIQIQVAKGQIEFKIGSVVVMSRLIENNFPPYEKILPSECKTVIELSTEDFIIGLKKVAIVVRENNNNVKIKVSNGKLVISSDETQVGQGLVELNGEGEGESPEASLNAQYLLDVLSHLNSDRVHLGLNDKLSPVKVMPAQKSGYQHIIMPLKV
jgi:DNA polymerase-3 subunit beta